MRSGVQGLVREKFSMVKAWTLIVAFILISHAKADRGERGDHQRVEIQGIEKQSGNGDHWKHEHHHDGHKGSDEHERKLGFEENHDDESHIHLHDGNPQTHPHFLHHEHELEEDHGHNSHTRLQKGNPHSHPLPPHHEHEQGVEEDHDHHSHAHFDNRNPHSHPHPPLHERKLEEDHDHHSHAHFNNRNPRSHPHPPHHEHNNLEEDHDHHAHAHVQKKIPHRHPRPHHHEHELEEVHDHHSHATVQKKVPHSHPPHHQHEHEHGLEEDHDHYSHALFHLRNPHGHQHPPHRRGHHDTGLAGSQSHSGDELAQSATLWIWLWAMGCSLLVSLASLVCLLLLPLIVSQGKPSRTVVDALAGFGAGSMLGDALLHQLPHAFAGYGGHSHGHGSLDHHEHEHEGNSEHAHGHSLEDLSVGLAVLAGILLFFVVEKIVRRTEQLSVHGGHLLGHSHHHHHHTKKVDKKIEDEAMSAKDDTNLDKSEQKPELRQGLRKRNTRAVDELEKTEPALVNEFVTKGGTDVGGKEAEDGTRRTLDEKLVEQGDPSRFVLSYLNLFSDGVHNFTDGMALGSAFLLHGTVGGWSRTLFLLAHELPQEVGDFGILLRSGFGVFEALAFNFLSALMALVGTALALLVGGNPGHSSLIEGFTAGGFIYIAIGAVMPDMHSQGCSFRTTVSQLTSLILGMGVAVFISLAE